MYYLSLLIALVLGNVIGWAIGHFFWEYVLLPILNRYWRK